MLQTLMGYSATKAGLVLSPAGLVTMLEMPILGILLARGIDARKMIIAGLLIVATAALWMSRLNLFVAPSQVVWPRIVQVLGAGMMFVPINTVAYRFVPKDQTSNASGLFSLVRNEGSSIGVALVTTLLARLSQTHQHDLSRNITRTNPIFMNLVHKFSSLPGSTPAIATQQALRAAYAMVQQQAAILSYLDLFRMFGFGILLISPLVLLMRRATPVKGEIMAH